mgnify:CR=1
MIPSGEGVSVELSAVYQRGLVIDSQPDAYAALLSGSISKGIGD